MNASFAPFLLQAQQNGISPWIWIILVVAVIVLLFWWLGRREPAEGDRSKDQTASGPLEASKGATAYVVPETGVAAERTADDLAVIEGIGPKIASMLHEKGITTFSDLAARDPVEIRQMLQAEGLRMADPESWPEQARLASEGRWDDLKKLQDELQAGRKME